MSQATAIGSSRASVMRGGIGEGRRHSSARSATLARGFLYCLETLSAVPNPLSHIPNQDSLSDVDGSWAPWRVGETSDLARRSGGYILPTVMLRHMRTTVRLNESLRESARDEATRHGVTLTSLIEQALRLVLRRLLKRSEHPVVKLPECRVGGGVLPGVNLEDSGALLDGDPCVEIQKARRPLG